MTEISWKEGVFKPALVQKLVDYETLDDFPLPYESNALLWNNLNLTRVELNQTLNVIERLRTNGKNTSLSC